MEQTAVDYLVKEIHEFYMGRSEHSRDYIIDQAKQMEKEQHNFTFEVGRMFQISAETTFDEYFAETYGSNGSDATPPQTDISKEKQKGILVELMELDAKDGLYRTKMSDEETAIQFAEWLKENRWFHFEDGKWSYTFEHGTSISREAYEKNYRKTTKELYQLWYRELLKNQNHESKN